jgi:DNA-binding transcriptional MerR regulator
MEKMLPPIPAKRYFTIGEVSELCGVKPYVLRYWEQEFTQLKPMKRRGNRRYYQRHEVLLIRRIRELLYDEGFTISGARNRLADMPVARAEDTQWDDDVGSAETPDDGTEESDLAEGEKTARAGVGILAGQAELAAAAQSSGGNACAAVVGHQANASVAAPLSGPPMAAGQLRDELLSIRDLLAP